MNLLTAVAIVAVAAFVVWVLGFVAELRQSSRRVQEQREKALLAPHAKWLHQHDIDRQFNAIVADLKAGAE